MKRYLVLVTLIFSINLPASAAVVLQYHHVSTTTPAITSTTPEMFKQHMQHLRDAEFNVVPLTAVIEAISTNTPLPAKTVAITFDDAYTNIYENAYPLLLEYGFPFTIFVATDPIDNHQRDFLSWQQLREMRSNGGTIANHSKSHTHLLRRQPKESRRHWRHRIRSEIIDAQATLVEQLGPTPRYFAFPYGEYDLDILRILDKEAFVGFGQQSGAVGTNSNRLILPRFPLSGRYSDFEAFKTKIQTSALPIIDTPRDPMTDGNPELTLAFESDQYDFKKLACYGPEGKINIEQTGATEFLVTASQPVAVGRSRFNCTMPVANGTADQFYWFSQLWIRKHDDGSWYAEP